MLRADLHTLYDLDLIGIDENLRVSVSAELGGSEYEALEGRVLTLKARPSLAALAPRWASFTKTKHLQAA
ncbi:MULTISPECIES: hypothetical protein [unclassified Mesorhizobium]|uniref:hypothetical protein n=1 Tax=unclassified Mesorhizobium TaxID=325217 RepID=UPI00041F74AB|nr:MULTISPECIES: hypothetical protein [unclassified Mesorhizobium]